MGQSKHLFGLRDYFAQFARLGKIEGNRLVADNVEAGFQKGFGYIKVEVILNNNSDKIYPLVLG